MTIVTEVTRTIDAPQPAVWAVLADFPNVADWSAGVKKSYATGEASNGVGAGAQRHCDLTPFGTVEETIREFAPEDRMVVSIDESTRIPVKTSLVTFSLLPNGNDRTDVAMRFEIEPKGGVLGKLLSGRLRALFNKAGSALLDDLDAEAQRPD